VLWQAVSINDREAGGQRARLSFSSEFPVYGFLSTVFDRGCILITSVWVVPVWERNCCEFAPWPLQLHPRHLTAALLRVPNRVREKFVREDFPHDENFLCYHLALSGLKRSFTSNNRA
jgi:hypothetical protein